MVEIVNDGTVPQLIEQIKAYLASLRKEEHG